MGCTSSKEVPLRERPIRRMGAQGRGDRDHAANHETEFWRRAAYLQEANLRYQREDIARAQGLGRTDDTGKKVARFNQPLKLVNNKPLKIKR